MVEKSCRQNNEKLLDLWMQKFSVDELFIDISIDHNHNIWEDCEEIAGFLDECCPVRPFADGSWSKYLPERIGEWNYIRCHKNSSGSVGKITGTASDEIPGDREVVTADMFLEVARGRQWVMDEDFDSVFDR